MTEPLPDDFGEEIDPEREFVNDTWESMKKEGVPLTAAEFLRRDLGNDPLRWVEYVYAEYLIDVPRQIRADVQDLAERLRLSLASGAAATDQTREQKSLPEDPVKAAIQAESEARGGRRPH